LKEITIACLQQEAVFVQKSTETVVVFCQKKRHRIELVATNLDSMLSKVDLGSTLLLLSGSKACDRGARSIP